MVFVEHDCPLCGDPTLGHAVEDESRTLCRECFLNWIFAAGATLEERITSMGYARDAEHAARDAEAMRAAHARLPNWNGG